MDEEEELENTLIGQEEEAPAMDTGDELMGAGQPMFTADPNVVAAVPGIENIRNPGAFNPANVEPVKPVGPPATIGESIRQTYDESVLADLIGRGFGQEAFQSQAPDGTPTFSIFNKRFGTLGSQVPYSEASPEAKAQAINFMLETGGQERPLPETPTSPVRSPEQVQSILDEQRAAQAASVASDLGATPSVTPPVERPAAGAQEQPSAVVSPFLQSPDTPSGLGGPLLRGFEMVNDAARGPNAPMGQDATRARLGGMTLNEYLNAPAGTPGVSGLRTDPQGRMVPNIAQFQAQPETAQPAVDSNIIPAVTQAPVDSAVPTTVAQPPVDALTSFERDSLARQQRIGGTGSFAGDSAAREARLAERDRLPGETQTERDTRIAQSRTTGGQTEGLSFDDARRRAEGQLAERGVRNPSASQVNALARSIQAAEPERLAELETKRALDAARIKRAELETGFEPKELDIGGKKYIQYTPTYIQPVIEDTPEKTGLQATLENLQSDLTSGRLTQEEYDIAVRTATNAYIGREEPKLAKPEETSGLIDMDGQSSGTTEGKNKLDAETAQAILNEAGGDKEEARRIARERGFVL
jgi:hypothetical protein